MSNDIIQYAFVAGEVSDKLFGRVDLEKYDFGVAEALNWFVDYRGGLTSRPGTIFVDHVQHPSYPNKLIRFQYSPDTANTYAILFGYQYIRFIQDGAYVLESPVTITAATKANPVVVTAVAHGFANGDWIKISGVVGMTQLNGRTFQVANKTANTFELVNPLTLGNVNGTSYTTYSSGGTVSRIYTVTHSIDADDFSKLKAYQIRDLIRLTHPDYVIRNLTRVDSDDWTLDAEDIGDTGTAPTGLTGTASAAGSAGVGFTVTAIDADGVESSPATIKLVTSIVNYAATTGSITFTWTAVTGAVSYNIYRTLILSDGTKLHNAMEVGYIGATQAPIFVDNNITPDFTVAPPVHYNPFADSIITMITVTAGGSGYTSAPTVSVTGAPGTGFSGFAVINGGAVIGVIIINRGSGYVSPIVGFSGGGGSGATATATAGDASGNNPATSTLWQQRQIYAATTNKPLTIFGSKPGQFSNMDFSLIAKAADSYEYDIDTPTVAAIRHLFDMRGGLVVMSGSGIWQLTGPNGVATAIDANADPQTFFGAADVVPLLIDTDLLYVTNKESTVRLLSYSDFSKVYGGQDMSILSNHLFKITNRIDDWTYQETPNRLVHAVREDGTLLIMTIVKEQNVYGWTRASTKGFFRNVLSVEEDGRDTVYTVVERIIGGNTVKFIEKFAPRDFSDIEDVVCLDSSLSLTPTYPAAGLTVSAATGTAVTVTATASVFSAGNVDSILRVGGGKLIVTAYVSGTVLTCNVQEDVTDLIPETTSPRRFVSGEWTLDVPVVTVSGAWHLEGETVQILADGSVIAEAVVTAGAVTFVQASTRVTIGLKYTCKIKTLPPTAGDAIIEGHRKSPTGVAVRINETRGLKLGPDYDTLYEMKDRTTEGYGVPTRPRSVITYELTRGSWNEEGQFCFVQDYPLPASILGIVYDLDLGDDNR